MGIYVNPGNGRFRETVNSEIYVDKTGLIRYTNSMMHTMQHNICVSRPRKRFADRPALVVELKWNDTAEGVVEQIKNREYCRSFEEYSGSTLLVGVSYDRQTKEHRCVIEKAVKPQ